MPVVVTQEDNCLGPEGATALAGALEKMPGMQTLYLVSWVGCQSVPTHRQNLLSERARVDGVPGGWKRQ